MSNTLTIEMETNDSSDASLTEVAAYLSYLKHVGSDKPSVTADSVTLALSIAKGLGDINNLGLTKKHRPLFAGGKTFHRNNIDEMKAFFEENKSHLLALAKEIVKNKFKGCNFTFVSGLANGFSAFDDVASAYSSLNSKGIESRLNHRQRMLRSSIIANLLAQTLDWIEKEVHTQQSKVA